MKSRKQQLEKARSLVKAYSDNNESVVDEFINERRQAAAEEAVEDDLLFREQVCDIASNKTDEHQQTKLKGDVI